MSLAQSRTWSSSSYRCNMNAPVSRRAVRCFASGKKPKVLLTREKGKNDKLMSALSKHGVECIELPLIEHSDGPDRAKLPEVLAKQAFDWVAITSPESAIVYLEAWEKAGRPKVRVAVVGTGTGEVLKAAGVTPDYVPSKALGKTMGGELPKIAGGSNTVLYPASVKASLDLQTALQDSGFTVTRMNTYNTGSVKSVSEADLQAARQAQVITYGSPTAVKAYVSLVGLEAAKQKLSVCIGSTSARACESAGLSNIYFPEDPGVDGWAEKVLQAIEEHKAAL